MKTGGNWGWGERVMGARLMKYYTREIVRGGGGAHLARLQNMRV